MPGFDDRRERACRVAFDTLVEAGDPVAAAIRDAVRDATTVEITEELMGSYTTMHGTWPIPTGMSRTEFALRMALQASGFEVIP